MCVLFRTTSIRKFTKFWLIKFELRSSLKVDSLYLQNMISRACLNEKKKKVSNHSLKFYNLITSISDCLLNLNAKLNGQENYWLRQSVYLVPWNFLYDTRWLCFCQRQKLKSEIWDSSKFLIFFFIDIFVQLNPFSFNIFIVCPSNI